MKMIDEAIKHCEEVAKLEEQKARLYQILNKKIKGSGKRYLNCIECAKEHRQLAEWLRGLKAYRKFADWLADAVLDEDWEESAEFYAEVLCRKLTKLGKLKVVDNKYMEINADKNE